MESPTDLPSLELAVGRLERRTRALTLATTILAALLGALSLAAFAANPLPDAAHLRAAVLGADSGLTLRTLTIRDAEGRSRLRLGAPLPGPIINGKEQRRGAPVSGIAIYDGSGDERGGFATSDGPADGSEAFIGLDSREGQVALFLANPHDGANLQVWDQRGHRVGLFAVAGAPYIQVDRGDSTLFSVPRADSSARR